MSCRVVFRAMLQERNSTENTSARILTRAVGRIHCHHRPLSMISHRIRLRGLTSTLPVKGRQPQRVLQRSTLDTRDVQSGTHRNAGTLGPSECFARSQQLLWSAGLCLETLLVWRTWTKRPPRHDSQSLRTPDSNRFMLAMSRRLCSTSRTTWPVETRMRCQNTAAELCRSPHIGRVLPDICTSLGNMIVNDCRAISNFRDVLQAYKSVKGVRSTGVWESMSKMCVAWLHLAFQLEGARACFDVLLVQALTRTQGQSNNHTIC